MYPISYLNSRETFRSKEPQQLVYRRPGEVHRKGKFLASPGHKDRTSKTWQNTLAHIFFQQRLKIDFQPRYGAVTSCYLICDRNPTIVLVKGGMKEVRDDLER